MIYREGGGGLYEFARVEEEVGGGSLAPFHLLHLPVSSPISTSHSG